MSDELKIHMPNPLADLNYLGCQMSEIGTAETQACFELMRTTWRNFQAAPAGNDHIELEELAMATCIARRLIQGSGRHGYDA